MITYNEEGLTIEKILELCIKYDCDFACDGDLQELIQIIF